MKRLLAAVSCMAVLLSGCGKEEPEPCTKGNVTAVMESGSGICYVGEVDIINDGQDGKAVRVEIRVWAEYMLDDEF